MKITDLALELHKFIETLNIKNKEKLKIHTKIIEMITKYFINELTESENND